MERRTFLFWLGEFICITAIGILPAINLLYWALIPALILIGLKVVEHRVQVNHRYQAIRNLLDLLDTFLPYGDADVRCTLHIPIKNLLGKNITLMQAFDYVPRGGGSKRKFSIEKGIIGRSFSVAGPRAENFENGTEYRERMKKEYGYSDAELGERTPDRRSYLAYPIVEGATEKVLGIVYFDSDVCGTFVNDENDAIYKMILRAIQPIKRTLE